LPTSEALMVGCSPIPATGAEQALAAIRERRAVQARYARPLSVTGALLFATTFGALPLAVYRYHAVPFAAETAVAAAAVLWALTLALAARALRKAGATQGAVAGALAPAFFFPPAA